MALVLNEQARVYRDLFVLSEWLYSAVCEIRNASGGRKMVQMRQKHVFDNRYKRRVVNMLLLLE